MNILDFEAYLFDMDGVIADTDPTHKLAFIAFLKEFNIDCTDAYFEQHISGCNNPEIARNVMGADTPLEKIRNWGDDKEAYFRKLYAPIMQETAGLTSFLQYLKKEGKKLAVCTSAPKENMDFILDGLLIRQYFDITLCESDIISYKPHPEIYLKALDALQVLPSNAVVFEDSSRGAAAGVAAGCKLIVVNNTKLTGANYSWHTNNFVALMPA